jgi:hypothetical protein
MVYGGFIHRKDPIEVYTYSLEVYTYSLEVYTYSLEVYTYSLEVYTYSLEEKIYVYPVGLIDRSVRAHMSIGDISTLYERHMICFYDDLP